MKKEATIKSLIGLTQEETAMLLGITRIHWTMFNTGRRDIPQAASERLAVVVNYLKKNGMVSGIGAKQEAAEKEQVHDWLKEEYKTVAYKLHYLERKIQTSLHIRKECYAALAIADYLKKQDDNEFLQHLSQSISKRACTALNKHSLKRLTQLELKKETLEMLKFKMEAKLKV